MELSLLFSVALEVFKLSENTSEQKQRKCIMTHSHFFPEGREVDDRWDEIPIGILSLGNFLYDSLHETCKPEILEEILFFPVRFN